MSPILRNRGFSLVEVMVALLLGLIILLALYITLMTNLHSLSTTEAQGNLTDNGRRAVNFIQQQLQQAGYRSFEMTADGQTFGTSGWDGLGWQANGDTQAIFLVNNDNNDELFVRYSGSDWSGIYDCSGSPVAANTAIEVRIYLDDDNLMCRHRPRSGAWSEPQQVATGIEALNFAYSLSSAPHYQTVGAPAPDWRLANRVQFALLVRSSEFTASGITNNLTYSVLDGEITAPNDRYLRAVHERAVTLRNTLRSRN